MKNNARGADKLLLGQVDDDLVLGEKIGSKDWTIDVGDPKLMDHHIARGKGEGDRPLAECAD